MITQFPDRAGTSQAARGLSHRIAGAPISWGVCEVPDWGHQMTPERVLDEMWEIGLKATEFGPIGFLPDDPRARRDLLASFGLAPVGGFVPVVLHDAASDPLPAVEDVLRSFAAGDAKVVVLAAETGTTGYDDRAELDEAAWKTLLTNLDRILDAAGEHGLTAALHPHIGTVVEGPDDVARVLEGSSVPLCLDTGHLLVGGTNPLELVTQAPERIAHAHLKDVDASFAPRIQRRELTYSEAVRRGMYRPLGSGDVDIAGIVRVLEGVGYTGWYVLEQDTILEAEPAAGEGPVADVRASVEFLRSLQ